MRRRRFEVAVLVVLGLVGLVGCEGKVIQNLGAIDARVQLRLDGLHTEILLLTEDGDRLYWDTGILSPTSAGILPIEELDTHVELWSMRNGQRHRKVYSGRLQGLRWNLAYEGSYRSLLGRIPAYAIDRDPEAEGPTGEMELTLITPKQGEFSITLYDVPIYPATLFGQTP